MHVLCCIGIFVVYAVVLFGIGYQIVSAVPVGTSQIEIHDEAVISNYITCATFALLMIYIPILTKIVSWERCYRRVYGEIKKIASCECIREFKDIESFKKSYYTLTAGRKGRVKTHINICKKRSLYTGIPLSVLQLYATTISVTPLRGVVLPILACKMGIPHSSISSDVLLLGFAVMIAEIGLLYLLGDRFVKRIIYDDLYDAMVVCDGGYVED